MATRGGGAAKKPAAPPIQASSKDEENFIQYVCLLFNYAIEFMEYFCGFSISQLMRTRAWLT